MKVRVKQNEHGRFIVQYKKHWYSFWHTHQKLVDPANRCPTYSGPLMKEDIEYENRDDAESFAKGMLLCSQQTVFVGP